MLSLNKKTGALLSIILIVTVWGSASAVTKLAVENTPAYLFAFLRNLIASVCLILYYFLGHKKKNQPVRKAPLQKMIWMGLTGVTFFYLFFNVALYYTTASAGALIQGFIPVAIILLSLMILKERLAGIQIAGILLSVVGVVLIGVVSSEQHARDYLLGNLLMIFAVLSWACYTILSKTVQQYDTVYVTMMSTCIGTICLIPAMFVEGFDIKDLIAIDWKGWLAVLYLGIFSSAICYVLYNRVVKILSGVQVGNFMNLDPVVGAVIAVILLNEKLSWQQIAGAALILIGVSLTAKNNSSVRGNGKWKMENRNRD